MLFIIIINFYHFQFLAFLKIDEIQIPSQSFFLLDYNGMMKKQLYLLQMLASHFFPKNISTRKTISIMDRRPSLGIHSFVASKEYKKEKRKKDLSQSISDKELQSRHNSLNLRMNLEKQQDKFFSKYEKEEQKCTEKGPLRKKTLYVKGFCKKPIFQNTIDLDRNMMLREVISSNCHRIIKCRNLKKDRVGTSIPAEANGKQFKLTKRKSKQASAFKGWEINYDDFNDF